MTSKETGGALAPDRIAAVGVGGGGTHALEAMCEAWRNGPRVIAINTDAKDLQAVRVPDKLQIGAAITRGLGCGGDAKTGRMAAESSARDLMDRLKNLDLVFVVVGLGGGTGTGAAPVVARLAHETGALVIAIATLPFAFEGEGRAQVAREGVQLLRDEADAVILAPNERLFKLWPPGTPAAQAFREADVMLGMGVSAIWKLLVRRGVVHIDFATLRSVVRASGGTSVFAYGEARGPERAAQATRMAIESPLLDGGVVLRHAQSLLVSIVGGPDLTLGEVETVMEGVRNASRKDAHVFMGAALDPQWGDTLSVTLISSERWSPEETAPAEAEGPDESISALAGRKKRVKPTQAQLGFEPVSKGLFKDVEPTYLKGEDLDVPTYIRHGVTIER